MTGWPFPSTRLGPTPRHAEVEQHLKRVISSLDGAGKLADLVLELAAAVDNAAEDIGGSRPQLTILREAVEIATALRGRAETRDSWHEGPPPREGRYRTRPIATKHECGNMPTRWRDGAWHWDGEQTKHRCDDQARQWFGRQR